MQSLSSAIRPHAQVDRLTPALPEKAFQGELVPQDPNDEPASVLLERIRSELTATKAKKRDRGSASPLFPNLP
ncbi:hypothetical protein [Phormidesmis sp. 146-33]